MMNSKKPEKKQYSKPVATSGANVTRYYPGKAPEISNNLSASDTEEEVEPGSDANFEAQTRDQLEIASKVIISSLKTTSAINAVPIDRELIRRRLAARRQQGSDSSSGNGTGQQESSSSDQSSSEDENSSPKLNRELLRKKLLDAQKNKRQQDYQSSESTEEFDSNSELSEYESEESITKIQRPVFISRNQRKSKIAKITNMNNTEILQDEDYEAELENRRQETLRLAALQVKQEAEVPDVDEDVNQVDDTDGVDEDLEFEEWKARELMRIKREGDLRNAREMEAKEVERRRKMSDQELLREDRKYFEQQNNLKLDKRKLGKSTQNHHIGAFFNDILDQKNVIQKYASSVSGSSIGASASASASASKQSDLPEVLKTVRAKNYGKSSQIKWKGLISEDTSLRPSQDTERQAKKPRN